MTNSIFLRLLNGLRIKYSLHDFFTFLKFAFKNSSVNQHSTIPFSSLKIKIVIISLPFRHDRRERIVEQFKNFNIYFEFFDAIHGNSQRLKAYDIIEFSSISKKYLSPGSIGCIASHISVWKNLTLGSYDGFLIFEDDIILGKNLSELNLLLNKYPCDAEIIYLGSGSKKRWPNMKKFSSTLSKPFSVRKGAYSYFLFKKGAIKLINEINKVNIVCGGIDSILGILEMRNKLIAYHLMPPICKVDYNLPSNIINFSNKTKNIQEIEFK